MEAKDGSGPVGWNGLIDDDGRNLLRQNSDAGSRDVLT